VSVLSLPRRADVIDGHLSSVSYPPRTYAVAHGLEATASRLTPEAHHGTSQRRLLDAVLMTGPVAVVAAVGLSLVTGAVAWSSTVPSWSAPVALVALALGIPHGAVDHLTHAPSGRRSQLVWAFGYLAVAVAAIGVILAYPAVSFVAVVMMSLWHFGSGDVEARADLSASPTPQRRERVLHAVASGAAPLLLPLTSTSAVAALSIVNPDRSLLLSPGVLPWTRCLVLVVVAASIVVALTHHDGRGALELALLTTLGLVATPLVAFGTYFACWHALRHTARLAQPTPGTDITGRELRAVVRAGLPALGVTIGAIAVGVSVLPGRSTLLGVGLAVVWGLTVPHMVAVGRFDRQRRLARQLPPPG
jgi:Brp/Blh family beta-carotene 15,15'-monooxygenase